MRSQILLTALLTCYLFPTGTMAGEMPEKQATSGTIFIRMVPNNSSKELWINVSKGITDIESSLLKLSVAQDHLSDTFFACGLVELEVSGIGRKSYSHVYALYPGDSIEFSFDQENQPVATITNRFCSEYELNFFYHLNKKTVGINRLYLQEMADLTTNSGDGSKSYRESIQYLDSLRSLSLLGELPYEELRTFLLLHSLLYQLSNDRRTGKTSVDLNAAASLLGEHHLLRYLLFRQFLQSYLEVKLLKTRGAAIPDYRKGYALAMKEFAGDIRDYMLFYCFVKTAEADRSYVANAFYRFAGDCQNPELVAAVKSAFQPTYARVSEDEMIDDEGSRVKFSAMVKSLKGQVVYIDFWASWCAPCLAAMPAGKRLRQAFEGKGVAVVYISLDAVPSAWKNILPRLFDNDRFHNYLLIDPKKASVARKYAIDVIPRYLIFDRTGKLRNSNAPGPEAAELHKLLSHLVAEK